MTNSQALARATECFDPFASHEDPNYILGLNHTSTPCQLCGELPAYLAPRVRIEVWFADEAPGDWVNVLAAQGMADGFSFRSSAVLAAREVCFADV